MATPQGSRSSCYILLQVVQRLIFLHVFLAWFVFLHCIFPWFLQVLSHRIYRNTAPAGRQLQGNLGIWGLFQGGKKSCLRRFGPDVFLHTANPPVCGMLCKILCLTPGSGWQLQGNLGKFEHFGKRSHKARTQFGPFDLYFAVLLAICLRKMETGPKKFRVGPADSKFFWAKSRIARKPF